LYLVQRYGSPAHTPQVDFCAGTTFSHAGDPLQTWKCDIFFRSRHQPISIPSLASPISSVVVQERHIRSSRRVYTGGYCGPPHFVFVHDLYLHLSRFYASSTSKHPSPGVVFSRPSHQITQLSGSSRQLPLHLIFDHFYSVASLHYSAPYEVAIFVPSGERHSVILYLTMFFIIPPFGVSPRSSKGLSKEIFPFEVYLTLR